MAGVDTGAAISSVIAFKTTPEGLKITLKAGSIVDEQVDVVINTTKKDLNLSIGGTSKVLLDAAGSSIQSECHKNAPKGVSIGEFVETSGGELPCKVIYHGVIDKWTSGSGEKSFRQLISACLARANDFKYSSIAAPAIGTGFLGFPHSKMAKFFMEEVEKFSKSSSKSLYMKDVRIVVLPKDQASLQAVQNVLTPGACLFASHTSTTSLTSLLPVFAATKEGIILTVKTGSIIKEKVDVILNSTPKSLDLTMGVISASILKAAGSKVQDELHKKKPSGLDFGELVDTAGGNLRCKAIYHGPIPPWRGGAGKDDLRSFFKNALAWAEEDSFKSLAIPPVGTGKLRYPISTVAKLLFEAIHHFSAKTKTPALTDIRIVLYEDTAEAVVAFTSQLHLLNPSKTQDEDSDDSEDFPGSASATPQSSTSGQKGTKAELCTPGGIKIILRLGSIIDEKVDALVNVTNKSVSLSSGVVSKLLLEAGGQSIQKECTKAAPKGLQHGEFVTSSAGKLSSVKCIHHCCLPEWKVGSTDKELNAVLKKMFDKILSDKMTSVALPALGTGKLKYPPDSVISTIIQQIYTFSQTHSDCSVTEVRIVVHDTDTEIAKVFESCMDNFSAGSTLVRGPNVSRKIAATTVQPLPDSWSPMDMDIPFGLIPLLDSNPECQEITKQFIATGGPDAVVQVQRVQNPMLYERYILLKGQMERTQLTKTSRQTERVLYHGTEEKALININSRGFNRVYCGSRGVSLGEGVYFSTRASEAADKQHAVPSNTYQYVYHSLVLTGDYIKGSYQCLEPPYRDQKKFKRFDSVVDDERKPDVFVIFYDAQAYPQYLITLLV